MTGHSIIFVFLFRDLGTTLNPYHDILHHMNESLKIFYNDLKNSFKDLLPIVLVVAFFQIAIMRAMPENLSSIIIGLFIRGLEIGIFPIAHKWGQALTFNLFISQMLS